MPGYLYPAIYSNVHIWTPPCLQVFRFLAVGSTAHVYPVYNCRSSFEGLDSDGLNRQTDPLKRFSEIDNKL